MKAQIVQLVDQDRNTVARARVLPHEDYYAGPIDLDPMPGHLRMLFDEYEQIVDGQMFSLLDEIEEKIAATSLRILAEDGREAAVRELQIYPKVGRVSFKLLRGM